MSPTSSQFPNYDVFLGDAWGFGNEIVCPWLTLASNVVVGTNPPYSAADFLSVYPAFGGTVQMFSGIVANGSPVVTGITSTTGLLPGQVLAPFYMVQNIPVALPFQSGTVILTVDSPTQVTLNYAAIADGTQMAVYTAPFIPLIVINLYVTLASASLVYNRWMDHWYLGMSLYIAHYLTLYLREAGSNVPVPANLSPGMIAQMGAAIGFVTNKAAGSVSMGSQSVTGPGTGFETWGAWNLTSYGQLFITIANVMGGGPMFLW